MVEMAVFWKNLGNDIILNQKEVSLVVTLQSHKWMSHNQSLMNFTQDNSHLYLRETPIYMDASNKDPF